MSPGVVSIIKIVDQGENKFDHQRPYCKQDQAMGNKQPHRDYSLTQTLSGIEGKFRYRYAVRAGATTNCVVAA